MNVVQSDSAARPGISAWKPLRQPVFRALWIASLTSNIGTWMQNVGAAWLMTSLTPSPVVVAPSNDFLCSTQSRRSWRTQRLSKKPLLIFSKGSESSAHPETRTITASGGPKRCRRSHTWR
jgi:hypothetical protein